MDEVGKVTSFDMVKTMAKEEAVKAGLYEVISDDVDEKYFAQLRNLSIHPEIIKQMAKTSRSYTHHFMVQDLSRLSVC